MGLTNTQREYASEHHKVVSDFLETRNLPEDEYYDVVVFAYLDAVMESDCALKDEDFVYMLFLSIQPEVPCVPSLTV